MIGYRDGHMVAMCEYCFATGYQLATEQAVEGGWASTDGEHGREDACPEHAQALLRGERPPSAPVDVRA